MKKKAFLLSLLPCLLSILLSVNLNFTLKAKSSERVILLKDPTFRKTCGEVMQLVYDSNFEAAEPRLKQLKNTYPNHPLIYLTLALADWWKIITEIDDKRYDKSFLAYVHKTINLAYQLYEKNNEDYEALFCLAGAYAFKGWLYCERDKLLKSALTIKLAMKYIHKIEQIPDVDTEYGALLAQALYNYYTAWIHDNYKIVWPLSKLFGKGDKWLGIKQLYQVIQKSFYTSKEALFFLVTILVDEESFYQKGIEVLEKYHKKYPHNAFLERYYAKASYYAADFDKTIKLSYTILEKINEKKFGYSYTSGRYANFFLGYIYHIRKDYQKAIHHYAQTEKFTPLNQVPPYPAYYYYALKATEEIAREQNKKKLAEKCSEKILKIQKSKKVFSE